MWRIIQGIGRGLRSVRPSQCYPQDCSDEVPNYHLHNRRVSIAHRETLRHCTTTSSGSPLIVARYDSSLKQVTFGATQPKDIHSTSDANRDPGDGANSKCYCQRCPPWHWHILENSNVLEECCSEKQEERREKQSKGDSGNTFHYQEWKEILLASPTLHTLGVGSVAGLTLSLYRKWSEHCHCPYQAKDEQQLMCNGGNIKHSAKYSYVEEQSQNELLWSNCKSFKEFFNSEFFSEASSSATVGKNNSKVIYEFPNQPSNQVISKTDVTQSAKKEAYSAATGAHGLNEPVNSLLQKSLDLATTVFSIQRDEERKNKVDKIYKDEDVPESELLSWPESDKSNVTDRTDSGCLSDVHQDVLSQTTTDLAITEDQYNEAEESNTSMTVSIASTERLPSEEPKFQVEAKDAKSEPPQSSRTQNDPEKSSADSTKMKILHERLLEIVKADRENQLEEIFREDGNTLLNTEPEEAIMYFQAGVMMGDPSSAFNLALCYHMGYGTTQDLEKARKLYEAAAAAGHGWAMYNLAVMVSQGQGGPCVPCRAHSLLQQAAELGIKEAVEALSELEMEKLEKNKKFQERPHLQKCHSESSLCSFPINQWLHSHSDDSLQSLLDEDISAESALSTDIVCQKD